MKIKEIKFKAGELLEKLNEHDFEFLRTNNLKEAYRSISVGENTIDKKTRKHVLSAGAHSNEVNMANSFNVCNFLIRHAPDVFISHKLRAETGWVDPRNVFREMNLVKTRTNPDDAIGVGLDRELTVNVNGELFVIQLVGRHRKEKFNNPIIYLCDSLSEEILRDEKRYKEILDSHEELFKKQMICMSVGDSTNPELITFKNIKDFTYTKSDIYLDKKNCFSLIGGKIDFISTKEKRVNMYNEEVTVVSNFMEALQRLPLLRKYDKGKYNSYANLVKGKQNENRC